MQFKALVPEGEPSAGGCRFAIPPGREADAALDLLDCLAAGFELRLCNDLDEGHEGVTLFRLTTAGLSMKIGGHGWQGEWVPIGEAGFAAAVAELAAHNRGGHWSTQGSLVR